MFADPTTDIGLHLVLSVDAVSLIFRIEIHPAGWGERLMLLEAWQYRPSFALHSIGDLHIVTIERRPFPTTAYVHDLADYQEGCLMAHGVVVDLLWYLRRMCIPGSGPSTGLRRERSVERPGRAVWQCLEAAPALYDKWITGQAIDLPDLLKR